MFDTYCVAPVRLSGLWNEICLLFFWSVASLVGEAGVGVLGAWVAAPGVTGCYSRENGRGFHAQF